MVAPAGDRCLVALEGLARGEEVQVVEVQAVEVQAVEVRVGPASVPMEAQGGLADLARG